MKELSEPQSSWDERRLRAYEGNLLIGMVKKLKMEHKIDVEIRGNNEESSKAAVDPSSRELWATFGTVKKKTRSVVENDPSSALTVPQMA